jgi:predicted thioesterase
VISVTAPTAGNYLLNQSVTVNFNCTDGGSGVATCIGTSANGSALDTASVGAKTFTVTATDNVGNTATPSVVNYTVAFGLQVLFDQSKANKSGSTVPIKIRLVDANGANVSSAATVVHAISVVQTGSEASPILDDAGNANPDFDFRYDAGLGGYIFNLKTTGYGTGSYVLNFVVGGSSTIYSVGFQVRQ